MFHHKRFGAVLLAVCLFWSTARVSATDEAGALPKNFNDVPLTHLNYAAISDLVTRGIVAGYPDGSFRPEDTVNRAEALKIILKGINITVANQAELPFSDTNNSSWYAKYVSTAVQRTIVSGYPDGTFQPEKTVNRAEALKMLVRATNLTLSTPSEEKIYNDVFREQWFSKYVAYAKEKNIVSPLTETQFGADTGMTRGDVAEMMYRYLYITERNLPRFPDDKIIQTIEGKATYYADDFQDKTTASGEAYDINTYTGASRLLPLGTIVRVVNKANNKAVIVKINDRNAVNDRNIIIDLSKIAFTALASIDAGILDVRVEVLGENKALYKKIVSRGFYENLTLDKELPTVFSKGETYVISGTVRPEEKRVIAFYLDSNDAQTSFVGETVNGRFQIPVSFDKAGSFSLAVVPESQKRGKAVTVFVLDYPNRTTVTPSTMADELSITQNDGAVLFSWHQPEGVLARLIIEQGSKRVTRILKDNHWLAEPRYFSGFKAGEATVSLESAQLSSGFSVDSYTTWRQSAHQTIFLTNVENSVYDQSKIQITTVPASIKVGDKLSLSGQIKAEVRPEAAVITPQGKIEKFTMARTGENFSLEIPITQKGTYLVEINLVSGEAIFNHPFYASTEYPLIPESVNRVLVQEVNLSNMRQEMLELTNTARATQGLAPLVLNEQLNVLAQYKAEDMKNNQYFAHTDTAGHDINYYAGTYQVFTPVRENLAKRNSVSTAFTDLMKSAIHSENIMASGVQRMGLWVVLDPTDGLIYFVQLLSINELTNPSTLAEAVVAELNKARSSALILSSDLTKAAQDWLPYAGETNSQSVLEDQVKRLSFADVYTTGIYFPPFMYSENSVADVVKNLKSQTPILESYWDVVGISVQKTSGGKVVVTVLIGKK